MTYDAPLVLTLLGQLQSVYDSVGFLEGKSTGELGVGDTLTRLCKKADQVQRELLATGYPVPDGWLLMPGNIKIGQPDANRRCPAWVVANPQIPAIREQFRQAIMRLQVDPPPTDIAAPPPKATANARMIDLIKDPATHKWSAQDFATRLNCSKSAIAETEAWATLRTAREMARQERAANTQKRRQSKG